MTDILTKQQVKFMRDNGKFGVLPEELKELCDNIDYLRDRCLTLERLNKAAELCAEHLEHVEPTCQYPKQWRQIKKDSPNA